MPSRAGSPNKNKKALVRLLEEKYPGYEPILEMVSIALNEENDIRLRFDANKEVSQYIYPKLKALEHSGSINSEITKRHKVEFFGNRSKSQDT